MKFSDVKITVAKKLPTHEIFKEYADVEMQPTCNAMQDGKEYISKGMNMPEGFCSWAWSDIQRDVAH
ncbi:MAG: TIGR04076 family protein, partial [Candidatus Bathyarchaeota archaeon]|nr:TIGR04076 family protein [Candidatus Bathyarchaeota archaeon]